MGAGKPVETCSTRPDRSASQESRHEASLKLEDYKCRDCVLFASWRRRRVQGIKRPGCPNRLFARAGGDTMKPQSNADGCPYQPLSRRLRELAAQPRGILGGGCCQNRLVREA